MTTTLEHIIRDLDDESLVKEYQNTKEKRYFDEIYSRFSGRVFGKCLTFFENKIEAEDCMQEIFIKVLLQISKFNGKSKFSTWLYAITYNFCVDRTRRKKRNPLDFNDKIYESIDDADEAIEEKLLLEMELEQLETVLNNIPTQDKAILLMKYLDEMSIKEIAETINKSNSAVKMQLKRAKSKCVQVHINLFGENI